MSDNDNSESAPATPFNKASDSVLSQRKIASASKKKAFAGFKGFGAKTSDAIAKFKGSSTGFKFGKSSPSANDDGDDNPMKKSAASVFGGNKPVSLPVTTPPLIQDKTSPVVTKPTFGSFGKKKDAGDSPTASKPKFGSFGAKKDTGDSPASSKPKFGSFGAKKETGDSPKPKFGGFGAKKDTGDSPKPKFGGFGAKKETAKADSTQMPALSENKNDDTANTDTSKTDSPKPVFGGFGAKKNDDAAKTDSPKPVFGGFGAKKNDDAGKTEAATPKPSFGFPVKKSDGEAKPVGKSFPVSDKSGFKAKAPFGKPTAFKKKTNRLSKGKDGTEEEGGEEDEEVVQKPFGNPISRAPAMMSHSKDSKDKNSRALSQEQVDSFAALNDAFLKFIQEEIKSSGGKVDLSACLESYISHAKALSSAPPASEPEEKSSSMDSKANALDDEYETKYETRVLLRYFGFPPKDKDSKEEVVKEWRKKGVGMIKVQELPDGGARIILRQEGTGIVLLNLRISGKMNFTMKKESNLISFTAVPNPPLEPNSKKEVANIPVPFSIKCKPEYTEELFEILEKYKNLANAS